MQIDDIRQRIRAVPFIPFIVRLADGRSFHVPHPDFIALSRREVYYVAPNADDITRLALEQIASVEIASADSLAHAAAPRHDELSELDFEELADSLADEVESLLGVSAAPLLDEAVSRAGIYGDHA